MALVLAITPGVDFILTSSRTLSQGKAAGFLTMLGILSGLLIVAILTALGLSELISKIPTLYEIIKWAGFVYLMLLAIETLRKKPVVATVEINLKAIPKWRIYFDGLMNNILNPKCALFALAVYPQFWHADKGSIVWQTIILALIYCVICFVVLSIVIVLTARLHNVISGSSKFRNFSRYLLASVFAALAIRLASMAVVTNKN